MISKKIKSDAAKIEEQRLKTRQVLERIKLDKSREKKKNEKYKR